jgi:hypothetical protein
MSEIKLMGEGRRQLHDLLRVKITRGPEWRGRGILAGGTVAAVIPAGFGLAQVIGGRPGSLLPFALATVAVIVTAILNATVMMYQARQETLRREIERRSADKIAEAPVRLRL